MPDLGKKRPGTGRHTRPEGTIRRLDPLSPMEIAKLYHPHLLCNTSNVILTVPSQASQSSPKPPLQLIKIRKRKNVRSQLTTLISPIHGNSASHPMERARFNISNGSITNRNNNGLHHIPIMNGNELWSSTPFTELLRRPSHTHSAMSISFKDATADRPLPLFAATATYRLSSKTNS